MLNQIIDQAVELFRSFQLVPQPILKNPFRLFVPEYLTFLVENAGEREPQFFGEASLSFQKFNEAGQDNV
jgi:hypothetical protein